MSEEKTIIRVYETADGENMGIRTTGSSQQVLAALGCILSNAGQMMK